MHLGNLASGPSKTILVWFDLSDVPADAMVMDASISLFRNKIDYQIALCGYAMRRSWGEYEATWKEAWTGDKWGADGALSPTSDYREGCLSSGLDDSGSSIDMVSWDVTSLVQGMAERGTREQRHARGDCAGIARRQHAALLLARVQPARVPTSARVHLHAPDTHADTIDHTNRHGNARRTAAAAAGAQGQIASELQDYRHLSPSEPPRNTNARRLLRCRQ